MKDAYNVSDKIVCAKNFKDVIKAQKEKDLEALRKKRQDARDNVDRIIMLSALE